MTELQIASTLELVCVLGLCSIVVFKILPTIRVDSFRQNMFAIRDRMFDFAAEGNIAFDDPAYVLLRRQMNGFIRFGHQLTVFRVLLGAAKADLCGGPSTPSFQESLDAALSAVRSEHTRERLRAFHSESSGLAIKYLVLGSPVIWIAVLVAAVPLACVGAAKGVRQLFRVSASKVLRGPLDARHIEEAATGAHPA